MKKRFGLFVVVIYRCGACRSGRGRVIESRLVGNSKEKVEIGDRVKVVFQQTDDPAIKLPCFELANVQQVAEKLFRSPSTGSGRAERFLK